MQTAIYNLVHCQEDWRALCSKMWHLGSWCQCASTPHSVFARALPFNSQKHLFCNCSWNSASERRCRIRKEKKFIWGKEIIGDVHSFSLSSLWSRGKNGPMVVHKSYLSSLKQNLRNWTKTRTWYKRHKDLDCGLSWYVPLGSDFICKCFLSGIVFDVTYVISVEVTGAVGDV